MAQRAFDSLPTDADFKRLLVELGKAAVTLDRRTQELDDRLKAVEARLPREEPTPDALQV